MIRTRPNTFAVITITLVLIILAGCSEDSTSPQDRLLALSKSILEFTAWSGSNPSPAQQKVAVTFEGRSTLNWTASTNSDWIRIGPRGSDTIFVSVISASLDAGTYEDSVMVDINGATNTPVRLTVRLTVLNQVYLSPPLLAFATLAGGDTPPAQELIIANFGVDTADYTAVSGASWLSVSSSTGQMPDTILVSVDISGLNAGLYIDSIVVNSPELPRSRAVVPCSLSLSSWESPGVGTTGVNLEDVQFVNPQIGWTSGWRGIGGAEPNHGLVFRSDDGGQSWKQVHDQDSVRFGGLAAIDAARCFVVVDSTAMFVTADTGKTWSRVTGLPIGAGVSLRDVAFANAAHGWAIGSGGTIIRTIDSGRAWIKCTTPTSQDLAGLVFLDTQTGWVCGNHGTILHTGDGGVTWVAQGSGTILDLRGVSFVDNLNGWAAGAEGQIMHTTSGGATWQLQGDVGDELLMDVVFANSSRGWVVGIDGSILRSDDGGLTWVKQSSGTTQVLSGMFFWDANLGWAVGGAGTVLRTANGGF